MYKFTISLADLFVGIECKNEYTKKMCKDYIVPDCKADIWAFADEDEVKREMEQLPNLPEYYAEFLCIYRNIARRLPEFSRAVFHGASITYKGKGLLFTAPSGTGKSTHIGLWRKFLGDDVEIVNGDKPILKAENGDITVYGTPWAGKEHWQQNTSAKLYAICLLQQGTENSVKKLTADECITAFMHQIYLPDVPDALGITLGILGKIIESVPVFMLSCDMSEQAVKSSFEAMLNEKYE